MAFKIAEAFVEIKDNTATVNRNLLALTTGVGRFESSSTKSFLSVSKALTGVGVVAVGVTAAFSTLTYALIRTGKSIISAGISFDQMRRGLTAVMGSADGARQEIVKLREVAKLPGLGMREALQGSINLQAVGFEAGKTRQILMEFGNALVTVGKGKAELDGVTLALTQMKARGKILAEEINQLSERVPQVRKVMMDAFGTGTAEDIQKLGVSVEDFIDVLVNGLGRLPRVAGGAALALENIADAADSIKRTFADMLLPFVEQFLDEAGNVVTAIDDWLGALTKFDNETRQKFAELTFIGVEMIKVMMKFMAKSVLEVAKVMWVPIETYMKSTLYDASNFIAKWVGRFGGYIIGGQEGALAGEAALTGDPQQRASVKAWIAQGGETKLNQQLQKSQEFFIQEIKAVGSGLNALKQTLYATVGYVPGAASGGAKRPAVTPGGIKTTGRGRLPMHTMGSVPPLNFGGPVQGLGQYARISGLTPGEAFPTEGHAKSMAQVDWEWEEGRQERVARYQAEQRKERQDAIDLLDTHTKKQEQADKQEEAAQKRKQREFKKAQEAAEEYMRANLKGTDALKRAVSELAVETQSYVDIWKDTMTQVQWAFESAFVNMFDNGLSAWQQFANSVKRIMLSTLAQIVSNKLMGMIAGSTGSGGSALSFLGGAGGSMASSGAAGMGSITAAGTAGSSWGASMTAQAAPALSGLGAAAAAGGALGVVGGVMAAGAGIMYLGGAFQEGPRDYSAGRHITVNFPNATLTNTTDEEIDRFISQKLASGISRAEDRGIL